MVKREGFSQNDGNPNQNRSERELSGEDVAKAVVRAVIGANADVFPVDSEWPNKIYHEAVKGREQELGESPPSPNFEREFEQRVDSIVIQLLIAFVLTIERFLNWVSKDGRFDHPVALPKEIEEAAKISLMQTVGQSKEFLHAGPGKRNDVALKSLQELPAEAIRKNVASVLNPRLICEVVANDEFRSAVQQMPSLQHSEAKREELDEVYRNILSRRIGACPEFMDATPEACRDRALNELLGVPTGEFRGDLAEVVNPRLIGEVVNAAKFVKAAAIRGLGLRPVAEGDDLQNTVAEELLEKYQRSVEFLEMGRPRRLGKAFILLKSRGADKFRELKKKKKKGKVSEWENPMIIREQSLTAELELQPEDIVQRGADGPLEEVVRLERAEAVNAALSILAPLEREIIVRNIWIQQRIPEIAERIGLTPKEVECKSRQARERLAKELSDHRDQYPDC